MQISGFVFSQNQKNIFVTFGTFYKVILSYIIYAQKFKVQNAAGLFYLKIKKICTTVPADECK